VQTNVKGNEKSMTSITPMPIGPTPGVGPEPVNMKPARNKPATNNAPLLRKNFISLILSFKVNTMYETTKPIDENNNKSTRNPDKIVILFGIGGN
jgi:hypothetical protein